MDPQTISPWISLALSAIALGTVVYGWFTAGEKKALKEVAALRSDLKDIDSAVVARFQLLDSKVQTIEGELKHLPDGDAAHRLELAVEKLTGKLEVLEERMRPIAAINARLQEWALERGK